MLFYSFGINHHQAPVELRDLFAFSAQRCRELYRSISLSKGAEFILLSTCNRFECYLYGVEEDVQTLQHILAQSAGTSWPTHEAFLYKDESAVMHILEVAGGLDSMVVGDAQILGQIKDAYRLAVEEEVVSSVLHRLMHTAFGTAKRILNETHLAAGPSSVAGTAAAVATKHLRQPAVKGSTILVLGAGEMGRLVVDALNRVPCLNLLVANRSEARLAALKEEYPELTAKAWRERYKAIEQADVTIVATASTEYVVEKEKVLDNAGRKHLVIDICMPRNVDPEVDSLEGFEVFNLDALQHEVEKIIALRQTDLPPARAICEAMLSDFVSWVFHHQAMQPAIHAIQQTFEDIRRQEIERNHHRFSNTDAKELDRLTKSIMQKVLAVPVVRLKNVGPHHIDYVNGIKLLQTLFARETCEEDFTSDYDLSKSIMDVLERSEDVQLAGLAACPFNEQASSMKEAPFIKIAPGSNITLGTRGSALALWQAHHVQHQLQTAGCTVNLQRITTKGDRILDRPFSQIEGKALFTKELDVALLDGRIDFAVHSLKDLPTELPEGLTMAAISRRENPMDAFVAHPSFALGLDDLPEGAQIGTSSLRRTAQLKAWRPDLNIVPIRGNIDTRIKKLDESQWHGIILAAAGLLRLELEGRIHTLFNPDTMLPAPGQGALGIVCAESNEVLKNQLSKCLHDEDTAIAVRGERALLQALDGGCHVPVGGLAVRKQDGYVLNGFVGTMDGTRCIRGAISVDPTAPERAGEELARRMLDQGAGAILEHEKNHSKSVS